jgi:Gram-negative bacterial TonB protein C-terminal
VRSKNGLLGLSNMRSVFRRFLIVLGLSTSLLGGVDAVPQNAGNLADGLPKKKVPAGVLLVKGAWSSASDVITPIPEGGGIVGGVYKNDYFGLAYPLPQGWIQEYASPPPSDSGYYVLAQITPAETLQGAVRGSILIAAQDLFFTLTEARSTLGLIDYTRDHLGADYKVERPPTELRMANRSFVRFDYFSPVADLHWRILATQTRCHVVQFVFTSRDLSLLDTLIENASTMKLIAQADRGLEAAGDDGPVCVEDYATGKNVIEREDPIFTERTFNPVPVRIIIDTDGKVKHIHFLSAFPSQAKAITDALQQWRFRPYLRDGQPMEVETGIMFGHAPPAARARRE